MRKDGTRFWAHSVVTALHDADGALRGFAKVTQDLTQRRHAESLADTAQRMDEFIAMLAHELRNPLAPIRNAVELHGAAHGRRSDRRGACARRSTARARSWRASSTTCSTSAASRAARSSIEKQRVDLRDIVARAVETSRPLIDAQRPRAATSTSPPQPRRRVGDPHAPDAGGRQPAQQRRAVHAAGRPHRLRCDRGGTTRCRSCACATTARGIEPELIDRIFDMFVQGRTRPRRGRPGRRASRCARASSSCTAAASRRAARAGQGQRVHRAAAARRREPAVGAPRRAARARGAPLRVLVVDDNVDAADSLACCCSRLGHEVAHRARRRGGAREGAGNFAPDVVLLDIGMPGMNGYEVARALRARSAATRARRGDRLGPRRDRQAREAGFDHHLVKPISESAIIELLAMVAKQRGSRKPG